MGPHCLEQGRDWLMGPALESLPWTKSQQRRSWGLLREGFRLISNTRAMKLWGETELTSGDSGEGKPHSVGCVHLINPVLRSI